MKKILFLMLSIYIFLFSLNIVKALNAGGDYGGGSDTGFDTNYSSTTNHPDPQVAGIRFSFVNSDGVHIGSQDYIIDEDYNIVRSSQVYVTSSRCSKVSYTSGNCGISWRPGVTISSVAKPLSTFQSYFSVSASGASYTFPVNVRNAVANNSYTGLYDPMIRRISSLSEEQNSNLVKAYFNKLLSAFGRGTLSQYMVSGDSEDIYDLFLIFEPLTVIQVNKQLYMGTAYELAQIAKSQPGGGFSNNCVGSANGAICDLSDLIRRSLPCTSYFEGSLYDQMSSMKSTVLIRKFSKSSYFNGAISIKYSSTNSVCSASGGRLPVNDILGNAGVGIGVVWLSNAIEGGDTGGNNPPPPGGNYNCTPMYNVGTCINSDTIYYSDSAQGVISNEYWNNCVFNNKGYYNNNPHKTADKNSPYTYYEASLSNTYCEVYCIENLTASFNPNNVLVKAGSHFTLGYNYVSGGRTCKTKFVDYTKFEQDLSNANKAIRQAYVDWQLEIKKAAAIEAAKNSPTENAAVCGYKYNVGGIPACAEVENQCIKWGKATQRPCKPLDTPDENGKCWRDPKCEQYGDVCTQPNYTGNTFYDPADVSFSISQGESNSWSHGGWCEGQVAPSADISSKETAYKNALAYAEGRVQEMKKCYNWGDRVNSIYNVNPSATLYYDDTAYYYYDDTDYHKNVPIKLNPSTSLSGLSDQSKCVAETEWQVKKCSDTSCPSEEVAMKNCGDNGGYVMMTRTAYTTFSLPSGTFQYVLKENNLSINASDLPSNNTNYHNVGYSNLPVSFSTPDGVYGSMHGKGRYDIIYSNLGHNKGNRTIIDDILSAVSANYGTWACQFTVESDLIPEEDDECPPGEDCDEYGNGDINVVYRTIDLENPFPDIDGNNRNTGSNWCTNDGDCSYNNNTVFTYITRNRGLTTYEMYNYSEPMYTFILTPSVIKEIRKYNASNSYASYTGSLGGKNYSYTCNNGKYCISEYLSHIINITGAKDQPGSCVADKYRNYNDTGNFQNCRY